jgi:hypothetical protein
MLGVHFHALGVVPRALHLVVQGSKNELHQQQTDKNVLNGGIMASNFNTQTSKDSRGTSRELNESASICGVSREI